jgi:3-hydroxyacyl-[acyl-carrier-protein] dehydratase
MPPKPLVDLDCIDPSHVIAGREDIRKCNPQRFEFEQLDGVLHIDPEEGLIVGFRDVRPDEFWVRGHIPGRPLLPGVLMCEAAAQLSSYFCAQVDPREGFVGFGGMEGVKFRRPVVPGDRVILVGKCVEIGSRRMRFACQGFVDGDMVYEGTIIGMRM